MLGPNLYRGFLGFLLATSVGLALGSESKVGVIIEKDETATYLETLDGFREELERRGKKYNFVTKNAYNNRVKMASLAKEFASDESIKSVVILGSVAATIGSRYIADKPIVFGGVNHPVRLGISGDNVTGTTYFISPAAVVNLIQRLDPRVRRIGLLFEPAEQNGASLVEVPAIEAAANERGLLLVKESVKNKESIREKAKALVAKNVDYLIIPTNKLLYSNVGLIRSITDEAGIPIVSFSRKGVFDGAMIGLTSHNRELGKRMGQMLVDIMERNIAPKEIEWFFPKQYSIIINDRTRVDLGVQIPKKIYRIATKINRIDR